MLNSYGHAEVARGEIGKIDAATTDTFPNLFTRRQIWRRRRGLEICDFHYADVLLRSLLTGYQDHEVPARDLGNTYRTRSKRRIFQLCTDRAQAFLAATPNSCTHQSFSP